MPSERRAAYTSLRADVLELVPPNAMRILDVGCSNGELGGALRSAIPGRRVTGIEGDSAFAAEAQTRLDAVVHADLNMLDWKRAFLPDQFDCLIFADVLEHLVDPWERLASACTCLRGGGTVIVSVPNIRHISALYSIFLRGRFPRNPRGLFDRTHLRWFTLADAGALLKNAGLTIERSTFNLRVRDQGGGRLNRLASRFLTPVEHFYPIREFLTYQACMLARKPGA